MVPAAVLKTEMPKGYVVAPPAAIRWWKATGSKANRHGTPAARRLSSKAVSVGKANTRADD
jgi:hypothetical protein